MMTRPKKTFQTTGPVIPSENYFVERCEETADFLSRIERGKYIVIFAPTEIPHERIFVAEVARLLEFTVWCNPNSGEFGYRIATTFSRGDF